MITVEEAKNRLQQATLKGKKVYRSIEEANGLVLAENIASTVDIPSFDNSAMDGYAIQWKAGDPERKLLTDTKVKAGDIEQITIGEADAIRIFTGAAVPNGADTVIPQEYVTIENGILKFEIDEFKYGSNLRKKGAQNKSGDIIAEKGSLITPGLVGLLSSVGIERIPVYAPPSIGIILTGDELIEPGEPLEFGKIYNSNGPILKSYLAQLGITDVEITNAVDEPKMLQRQINLFLKKFDILILSGGISVGDYDFVKAGLENAGVEQILYKIKQKPGKPLYVGQRENQWIFALPGNPASTLTCFNQYVKPAILEWLGKTEAWRPTARYPLASDYTKISDITFFLKAKLSDGKVHILPGQESFNLISYGTANCLAEIPHDVEALAKGSLVAIYAW